MNRDEDLELVYENMASCYHHNHKDEEGGMALNQFETIVSSVERLKNYINDPKQQLPAWVQSKITLAADYIATVADYIESGHKTGDSEVTGISPNGKQEEKSIVVEI
jgi:hypothetical protein